MRNDDDPAVRARYAPGVAPAMPRIMERFEMLSVVGDQRPAVDGGNKQVLRVGSTLQPQLWGQTYIVATSSEHVANNSRHIVIELQANHAGAKHPPGTP